MKLTVREIALIGMMVAVIEVCKVALSFLPNVELTSFWLILFTLYFGRRTAAVVPVFILVEGLIYGFGLWWLMYLYVWPLLVLLTWLIDRGSYAQRGGAVQGALRKGMTEQGALGQECERDTEKPALAWAILSGAFGLFFGALCAIPYFVIGISSGGGVTAGLRTAFAWWVAGIPWDLVHGSANFILMLILYHPVRRVMQRVNIYIIP